MRVLVLYECSGVVRNAFAALGHDAWSCDIKRAEQLRPDDKNRHYQGDVWACLSLMPPSTWDLIIAHPMCDYLCAAGQRWLWKGGNSRNGWDYHRWLTMRAHCKNFRRLYNLPVPRLCIENPHPHIYATLPPASQIIQPWMFGHAETKETYLWLKGLPQLVPTNIIWDRKPLVHHESPGPQRKANRSRTRTGIAEAMASQWSI